VCNSPPNFLRRHLLRFEVAVFPPSCGLNHSLPLLRSALDRRSVAPPERQDSSSVTALFWLHWAAASSLLPPTPSFCFTVTILTPRTRRSPPIVRDPSRLGSGSFSIRSDWADCSPSIEPSSPEDSSPEQLIHNKYRIRG
jgi:hypothetical protein